MTDQSWTIWNIFWLNDSAVRGLVLVLVLPSFIFLLSFISRLSDLIILGMLPTTYHFSHNPVVSFSFRDDRFWLNNFRIILTICFCLTHNLFANYHDLKFRRQFFSLFSFYHCTVSVWIWCSTLKRYFPLTTVINRVYSETIKNFAKSVI